MTTLKINFCTAFKIGDCVKPPNRKSGIISKIDGEYITYILDDNSQQKHHYSILRKCAKHTK